MRPEIIAEIGINHNGDMDLARRLIGLARGAGADVAKFQLYDPEILLNEKDFLAKDWDCILKSRLTHDQARMLKEHCDSLGIEFMASAFDLERLGWLEELEVRRHKIASRMVYDVEYCRAVQGTYRPYLVSTGWINDDNPLGEKVGETLARLGIGIDPGCQLLYCVSRYPVRLGDIRFGKFDFIGLGRKYSGFSDHTVGLTAAKVALAWGAGIVEKHFTLSRSLPGPDQAGSMEPNELGELCKFRDELCEMGGFM